MWGMESPLTHARDLVLKDETKPIRPFYPIRRSRSPMPNRPCLATTSIRVTARPSTAGPASAERRSDLGGDPFAQARLEQVPHMAAQAREFDFGGDDPRGSRPFREHVDRPQRHESVASGSDTQGVEGDRPTTGCGIRRIIRSGQNLIEEFEQSNAIRGPGFSIAGRAGTWGRQSHRGGRRARGSGIVGAARRAPPTRRPPAVPFARRPDERTVGPRPSRASLVPRRIPPSSRSRRRRDRSTGRTNARGARNQTREDAAG